jgi:hypothetical protein
MHDEYMLWNSSSEMFIFPYVLIRQSESEGKFLFELFIHFLLGSSPVLNIYMCVKS